MIVCVVRANPDYWHNWKFELALWVTQDIAQFGSAKKFSTCANNLVLPERLELVGGWRRVLSGKRCPRILYGLS